MSAAPPSRIKQAIGPGWSAVLHNWRPFVLIQVFVVLVVVAYYTWPPAREAGEVLARWKAEGGFWFPALSTAVAAGILPEIARRVTKAPRLREFTWGTLGFQFLYFAGLGILIDRLYWTLGALFGDKPNLQVVIIKVLCDMIIFSGLISMPLAVFLFAWRDNEFSLSSTVRVLSGGEFMRRYVPTLVLCWLFWFPVVAALYSLPVSLQFMLALLAEAAWSLLLVHIATHP